MKIIKIRQIGNDLSLIEDFKCVVSREYVLRGNLFHKRVVVGKSCPNETFSVHL